jgi:transcriptional regulator with PAS, ATPase and Fis domain
MAYDFPGNVRELQNIIASAVLVEPADMLRPESIAIPLPQPAAEKSEKIPCFPGQMEQRHIRKVLEATQGDRARAAGILGINLSTVYRKIKRYGL